MRRFSTRLLSACGLLALLAGASVASGTAAHNGNHNAPTNIATTASIVKIDTLHRTLKVRSASHDVRSGEGEMTVLITDATKLRDDIRPIEFDDFRIGETLSIWGALDGSTLTATRITKWPE